ncbi:885_t:CDS:2, partial [Ambispora leptoticha]
MSKIANRIIPVPLNVKVVVHKEEVVVEGPLGRDEIFFPRGLEIVNKEGKIFMKSKNMALAGTHNSLIYNAIKGVTEGYQEVLEVKGIGYKVSLKDNKLEFLLGKSHPIFLDIPKGIQVKTEGNKIIIRGINKQRVRKFAASDIKPLRLPKKKVRRQIRKRRSNSIKGTEQKPRVVLSESNRFLRVQAIDDKVGRTLLYLSTADLIEENKNFSRKNKEYAKKLGELFAEKLRRKGKEQIVFDRNARLYHGKKEKDNLKVTEGEKKRGSNRLEKKEREFERKSQYVRLKTEKLETKRPVTVTKGGRRFSFTSLVLVKDEEKKAIAFACGSGKEAISAFRKSVRKAQKKLITYFSSPPRTIPRNIIINYKATTVFMKAAPPGSGIKAGGVLNKLFKFLEIKDISTKIIGSRRNKLNKKKIVGRGEGSGKGKTCGRGQKGQKARKSGHTRPGFEGGQTPVYRRFPKRGFKTKSFSYQVVNLEKLENDAKVVNGQTVDFTQSKFPVKILGKGDLTKSLTVKASFFSQAAQEKIVKSGGKFHIVESQIETFLNQPENADKKLLHSTLLSALKTSVDNFSSLPEENKEKTLKDLEQEVKQLNQALNLPNNPAPDPQPNPDETLDQLKTRATTQINEAINSTNGL